MRSRRRSMLSLLLLALPVWLGALSAASAQVVTADVNGDGIRDRIEAGRSNSEIVIRLSGLDPGQRLRTAGSILDVVVTDIDHDGDSDLVVATTTARRRVGLFVWTNSGQGRFISRARRHAAPAVRWIEVHRVEAPAAPLLDDDLCGDPNRLLVLPSVDSRAGPIAGEAVRLGVDPIAPRAGQARRAPRGPPSTLLHS